MRIGKTFIAACLVAASLVTFASPAEARWRLVSVEVADVGKGAMAVTPQTEWNRSNRRESPRGESWTQDGFALNRLDFAGEIAPGDPIFKERRKREQPMPKFEEGMLPTDWAELFESSFRIFYGVTEFNQRSLEPAKLGSVDAVKVEFDYALPNDALVRRGEARLAVHNGQLYLISFVAPELHYFEASIDEVRTIMDTVTLN